MGNNSGKNTQVTQDVKDGEKKDELSEEEKQELAKKEEEERLRKEEEEKIKYKPGTSHNNEATAWAYSTKDGAAWNSRRACSRALPPRTSQSARKPARGRAHHRDVLGHRHLAGPRPGLQLPRGRFAVRAPRTGALLAVVLLCTALVGACTRKIGRASCRERV